VRKYYCFFISFLKTIYYLYLFFQMSQTCISLIQQIVKRNYPPFSQSYLTKVINEYNRILDNNSSMGKSELHKISIVTHDLNNRIEKRSIFYGFSSIACFSSFPIFITHDIIQLYPFLFILGIVNLPYVQNATLNEYLEIYRDVKYHLINPIENNELEKKSDSGRVTFSNCEE